ncbi:hypothetical protein [Shewanella putrefaciens]|uniref:hypothetical protein n=1 Tax=Shewanella putrefaciens TaxID=24 RepID=UPI0018E78DE8|nr:hypothetical protein [Shewanella putrefaciens]
MIFRTTLKAGQTNVLNKTGRHFYLLTAADEVRVRFRDGTNHTVDFESPLREGMSADFAVGIDEITLTTETAQYIEFWLGETKLDYSKLAAGGASATVGSGRAVCELGHSLAIPADFRRKSINIQALTDVTIGGLGVGAGTGYAMKAGEVLKLNTRGDIYSYLAPARVDQVQSNVSFVPVLAPADSNDANGYQHVDILKSFFYDPKTGNLVAGYGRMVYSQDGGNTWIDSNTDLGLSVDPSNYFEELGQTTNGLFIFKRYYSRVGVSRDGGKSFNYYCGVQGAINAETGLTILSPDAGFCYTGWISEDEKNIILCDNGVLWETFDAGVTWYKTLTKTNNYFDAITKSGGVIYAVQDGELYTVVNRVVTKKGGGYSSGDCSIAAIGSKVYWYAEGNKKLYYTPDGGDTITQVTLNQTHKAGYIKQIGESLIIGGLDKLGFIKKFGGEVLWVSPSAASGKTLRGDRIVVTADSIIVKQTSGNEDVNPAATVYPVSFIDGARAPVPLQWLAELN